MVASSLWELPRSSKLPFPVATCCVSASAFIPRLYFSGSRAWSASGKSAPPTATAPTSTPIAAVRSSPKSPISPPLPASNCATCTSPSPASKISFCTTPEGVCANELESLFRHACARCPRRAPQFRGAALSNFLAASDVRLHLRPRHGRQRLHAAFLQEPPAPRNHGHLHGRHRHLGRCHAADC